MTTPKSITTSDYVEATSGARDDIPSLVVRTGAALKSQCVAAHEELQQMQHLLSDATRNLLDCFHAAARDLADYERARNSPEQSSSEQAAARVEANLLAASQHLQFSDLVGQLLTTTEERIDALLLVSQNMQSLMLALSAARDNPDEDNGQFDARKQAFFEALQILESRGPSRVRQTSMEAGDAQLF
ncbi:MAG: hypothetical protein ABI612_00830 [Betaproteobacteria bacterium]